MRSLIQEATCADSKGWTGGPDPLKNQMKQIMKFDSYIICAVTFHLFACRSNINAFVAVCCLFLKKKTIRTKLFTKVISRLQTSPIARTELNMSVHVQMPCVIRSLNFSPCLHILAFFLLMQVFSLTYLTRDMRFPTMWDQRSLIRAFASRLNII